MKAPLLFCRRWIARGFLSFLFLSLAGSGKATTVIVNGGFENPSLGAGGWVMSTTAAPGWSTTVPDHLTEVWTSGLYGVAAFEGNQFVELNANQQGMLYQDVSGLAAGLDIDFSFAHRGRLTNEAMSFTITDLGKDGIFGTVDDTTLFSKVYTDGTAAWGSYSSDGESAIVTTGDTLRFTFQSLVPGSWGNFLDGVDVSVSAVANTPEPGAWAAMVLLLGCVGGSAVYRRVQTRFSPPR